MSMDLSNYSAGALKVLIEESGLDHSACVEKSELRELAYEALAVLDARAAAPAAAPASEPEAADEPEEEEIEPEPEETEETKAAREEVVANCRPAHTLSLHCGRSIVTDDCVL